MEANMIKDVEMGISIEYPGPEPGYTLAVDWCDSERRWAGTDKEMYERCWQRRHELTEKDREQVLREFKLWNRRDEYPAEILWSKSPTELRMGSQPIAA